MPASITSWPWQVFSWFRFAWKPHYFKNRIERGWRRKEERKGGRKEGREGGKGQKAGEGKGREG